jgi:prepilin-type N-terminal cleavage/methylation domain-containing protein
MRAIFPRVPSVKAFTLVEIVISLSIMAIILGISFSAGPQAMMRLSLADNVSTIELMVREAQLQGSSINSVNGVYGGAGVYFNLATSTAVVKFRDRVMYVASVTRPLGIGDGLYESTPVDELYLLKTIDHSHKISQLCVESSGATNFTCNADQTNSIPIIRTLTVSFLRPSQEPNIFINDSTTTRYDVACIQVDALLAPQQGYSRSILVYRSGLMLKKVAQCSTL